MKKLLWVIVIATFAACSSAKKNLVGYWYKPKTLVNIRFNTDNTFEYNDYDSATNRSQTFTGTYKLNRPVITLQFPDKTTETLTFDRMQTGNKNYYVKRNDNFFIKGDRVNHAIPPDTTSTNK